MVNIDLETFKLIAKAGIILGKANADVDDETLVNTLVSKMLNTAKDKPNLNE